MDAEIERLRRGIREIQDYHANNHRTSLPGGTTKACQRLLNGEAAEAAKEQR